MDTTTMLVLGTLLLALITMRGRYGLSVRRGDSSIDFRPADPPPPSTRREVSSKKADDEHPPAP